MSSLLGLQAYPLDSMWGSEDHSCGTSHMLCIVFLFPPLVVYSYNVYKLETSIVTKIVSSPIFVLFYKIDEISCILYVGLLFSCNRL